MFCYTMLLHFPFIFCRSKYKKMLFSETLEHDNIFRNPFAALISSKENESSDNNIHFGSVSASIAISKLNMMMATASASVDATLHIAAATFAVTRTAPVCGSGHDNHSKCTNNNKSGLKASEKRFFQSSSQYTGFISPCPVSLYIIDH